jgi:hypothetical protein
MRLVAVAGDSDRAHASLAVADRHQLALFDTWASGFLDEVPADHRAVLTSYVRWAQRRRLSRRATTGTLGSWSTLSSRQQITQAAALLDWLDARHANLAELDQTLLDAWIAGGTTTRAHSYHFVTWAQRQRLARRHLRVPHPQPGAATALAADDHARLVARLVVDTTIPTRDRVAGLLVTLYAQPASRIVRLQQRHLHTTCQGLRVELGYPPIDPAAPLDRLLGELADPNADPHDWLFPGATHGQPLHAKTLGQRLLRHGINRAARVAALHHLIVNVPAPVLADMIGYNAAFVADTAAQLGTPWTHYAALRHRM